MIVVSDTSPLNYLAIINQVDLLPQLFGKVVIPTAVMGELTREAAPKQVRALITTLPNWLIEQAPDEEVLRAVTAAGPRLGAGEAQAISLAKQLGADLLLMDERRAIRVARQSYHLRATGLLGVLELASVRGLVDLPEALSNLATTTFRAPKATIARLLEEAVARARNKDAG